MSGIGVIISILNIGGSETDFARFVVVFTAKK